MHLTSRVKLFIVFGIILVAFAINAISSRFMLAELKSGINEIQNLFLPKIISRPQFEKAFDTIQRTFQDAVSASDREMLAQTSVLKKAFLDNLSQVESGISPSAIEMLKVALEDYYVAALDVSQRLLENESGEAVVAATSAMQARQQRVSQLIETTFAYDTHRLSRAFSSISTSQQNANQVNLITSLFSLLCLLALAATYGRNAISALEELTLSFQRFGRGDFSRLIPVSSKDEFGKIALLANDMARNLEKTSRENERNHWLKDAQAGLSKILATRKTPEDLANYGLEFIAQYLDVPMAALFYKRGQTLELLGRYAVPSLKMGPHAREKIEMGEGLVGQVAQGNRTLVIQDIPSDYWHIYSGIGDSKPNTVVLVPLRRADTTSAVLELALFKPWTENYNDLIQSLQETLAATLENAFFNQQTEYLLEETKHLKNEALSRAIEAQTASRHKSEFLANMSHELRTPLNGILVLSQLFIENAEKNLNDNQIKNAKAIYSSGKDLLGLIDDILDLSKVEAGKAEVSLGVCKVSSFVDRIEELFRAQFQSRKIELQVETDPGAPETFTSDFRKVEQILRNLISNALKFTEKGRVNIRFFSPKGPLEQFGSTQDPVVSVIHPFLAVSVQDTGIGIPPEKQSLIFESFRQADSSIAKKYKGTGLGLTISLNLARRLGGDLRLSSQSGKGSTFTLILPYGVANGMESDQRRNGMEHSMTPVEVQSSPLLSKSERAEDTVMSSESLSQSLYRGKKILVADDDIRNIYALRQVILPTQAEVVDASTGEEAIRILETNGSIDLILMDMMMPKIDGMEAIRIIRRNPKYAHIPIIALTAKAMEQDKEECLNAGANDYLSKPVDLKELLSLLRIWLSSAR